ncbi:MAG TPA: hypothetical protein VLC09_06640 [Polyangiaceae bacterium]|nr:hypothetical protein [Polyangiaceae bacterium]
MGDASTQLHPSELGDEDRAIENAERALDDASGFVPAGRSALLRLRAGEISEAEYAEQLIDQAVAPYVATLDAAALGRLREVLRGQLAEDLGLQGLFERAVSAAPTEPKG